MRRFLSKIESRVKELNVEEILVQRRKESIVK
jgi:hypothetical protein